jgi:hypothetical protein
MRYFLDKNGAKTFRLRGEPGDGHVHIAKEVLPQHGVKPLNYADYYDQMFRLKFVRVVEHGNGQVEVEYRGKLTSAQKRFVEELERQGKRVVRVNEVRG